QWESQPKGSRPPVVVVSALSKVTDGLLRTADFARAGDDKQSMALVLELGERHAAIARTLTTGERAEQLVKALQEDFGGLAGRVVMMAHTRTVTPAPKDGIAAPG